VTPACTGTPVTLPTNLSAHQVLWLDINFSPTSDGSFTDTLTISGFSFFLSGSTGSPATPVPTLSSLGLISLALFLAGMGLIAARRARRTG
jgi:IPTL-CTERM motif